MDLNDHFLMRCQWDKKEIIKIFLVAAVTAGFLMSGVLGFSQVPTNIPKCHTFFTGDECYLVAADFMKNKDGSFALSKKGMVALANVNKTTTTHYRFRVYCKSEFVGMFWDKVNSDRQHELTITHT